MPFTHGLAFSIGFDSKQRKYFKNENNRKKACTGESCGLVVEYSAHDWKVMGSFPVQ